MDTQAGKLGRITFRVVAIVHGGDTDQRTLEVDVPKSHGRNSVFCRQCSVWAMRAVDELIRELLTSDL